MIRFVVWPYLKNDLQQTFTNIERYVDLQWRGYILWNKFVDSNNYVNTFTRARESVWILVHFDYIGSRKNPSDYRRV